MSSSTPFLAGATDYVYHHINTLSEEITNEQTVAYRVQYTWADTDKKHSHTLYPTLDTARIGIENRLARHNRNNPTYPLNVRIIKVTITTETEEIPYQ